VKLREETNDILQEFRSNILFNYIKKLYFPILKAKKTALENDLAFEVRQIVPGSDKLGLLKALFKSSKQDIKP